MSDRSEKMLETLVRHRFYSCVDWAKCSEVKMGVLERELVAVVEACIHEFAPEFSKSKRTELIEDVIAEVRRYDCAAMLEYSRRLNPPIPLRQKVGQFVMNKLHSMTHSPLKFRAEQLRSTPEAG